MVEGAPHQLEHASGLAHFRRPFGYGPKVLHRVERRRREAAADAVAGNEQYRNVIAEHLRCAGKAVLDPGAALHREHAGALAVAGAADAVGDADPDALLAAHDRPDADLGAGIDERLARIADQVLDPFSLENARDGLGNLHVAVSGDGMTWRWIIPPPGRAEAASAPPPPGASIAWWDAPDGWPRARAGKSAAGRRPRHQRSTGSPASDRR
jgi:hypothetical protein